MDCVNDLVSVIVYLLMLLGPSSAPVLSTEATTLCARNVPQRRHRPHGGAGLLEVRV